MLNMQCSKTIFIIINEQSHSAEISKVTKSHKQRSCLWPGYKWNHNMASM